MTIVDHDDGGKVGECYEKKKIVILVFALSILFCICATFTKIKYFFCIGIFVGMYVSVCAIVYENNM